MTRFLLAFACFFRLLFLGRLPARAAEYLPEGAAKPALPPAPEPDKAPKPEPKVTAPAAPPKNAAQLQREGALTLLALLQREGRLIDFLREDIDGYDDADIGAAVRDIHRGCKKVLDEHVALEPVMPGDEDSAVQVKAGFDPGEIKLIGKVAGEPPFAGTLRHHGWRATRAELPALSDGVDRRVVAPAEVELA